MRYLKELSGSPQDMATQVLAKSWKDGTKENALDVVELVPSYPDDVPIREVAEGLLHHYAVLIEEKEGGIGIITRADLVKLLL